MHESPQLRRFFMRFRLSVAEHVSLAVAEACEVAGACNQKIQRRFKERRFKERRFKERRFQKNERRERRERKRKKNLLGEQLSSSFFT